MALGALVLLQRVRQLTLALKHFKSVGMPGSSPCPRQQQQEVLQHGRACQALGRLGVWRLPCGRRLCPALQAWLSYRLLLALGKKNKAWRSAQGHQTQWRGVERALAWLASSVVKSRGCAEQSPPAAGHGGRPASIAESSCSLGGGLFQPGDVMSGNRLLCWMAGLLSD